MADVKGGRCPGISHGANRKAIPRGRLLAPACGPKTYNDEREAPMKRIFLASAATLLLAGCAHREAEYGPAYGYPAGGGFYGDCIYFDLCGPAFYGSYFYGYPYYPYYPQGPRTPDRARIERASRPRTPRTVTPPLAASHNTTRTVSRSSSHSASSSPHSSHSAGSHSPSSGGHGGHR